MRRQPIAKLSLMMFALAAASLDAQTPAPAPPVAAPTITAKILARMQTQFTTTSVDEQELITAGRSPAPIPSTNFEMRRLRFGAEIEVNKWIQGMFETEFAMARLQMRNVFINLAFSPGFEVRVGQYKKPFSTLELISETTWPIIERGVRIRGLNDQLLMNDSVAGGTRVLSSYKGVLIPGEEQTILDVLHYLSYDLGAGVHGTVGKLGYDVGVFNGPGSDSNDENDAKSYSGRLTYKLPSKTPVIFGAAFGHRETRTATKPVILNDGGNAVEVDVEIGAFRRRGLHFMGEASTGRNLAVADDFRGAQGILAYFKPVTHGRVEGVEFAGRASYGDPRKKIDGDAGLLLTPGFNVYFVGRNRLMMNWDVYKALGDRLSGATALRIQAQFYY